MSSVLQSIVRRPVPPPVAAGIGLVAAGADAAKALPSRALALPVTALSAVVRLRATLREEYAELALRGEATVSRLRHQDDGVSVDDVIDPFHLADTLASDSTADGGSEQGGGDRPASPGQLVTPGATLSHDELPLEDYDHLTIGALRSRIRRLDAAALLQLRDYERAHADRLPVMLAFDNRLKALAKAAPDAAQATLVAP